MQVPESHETNSFKHKRGSGTKLTRKLHSMLNTLSNTPLADTRPAKPRQNHQSRYWVEVPGHVTYIRNIITTAHPLLLPFHLPFSFPYLRHWSFHWMSFSIKYPLVQINDVRRTEQQIEVLERLSKPETLHLIIILRRSRSNVSRLR